MMHIEIFNFINCSFSADVLKCRCEALAQQDDDAYLAVQHVRDQLLPPAQRSVVYLFFFFFFFFFSLFSPPLFTSFYSFSLYFTLNYLIFYFLFHLFFITSFNSLPTFIISLSTPAVIPNMIYSRNCLHLTMFL